MRGWAEPPAQQETPMGSYPRPELMPRGLTEAEAVQHRYVASDRLRIMCGHVREMAARRKNAGLGPEIRLARVSLWPEPLPQPLPPPARRPHQPCEATRTAVALCAGSGHSSWAAAWIPRAAARETGCSGPPGRPRQGPLAHLEPAGHFAHSGASMMAPGRNPPGEGQLDFRVSVAVPPPARALATAGCGGRALPGGPRPCPDVQELVGLIDKSTLPSAKARAAGHAAMGP